MSDYDHMCTECDRKPCIESRPKMAVPRELQTDYEMMVTANLLMAASIDSLKRKDEQLKAENAKLRDELAKWERLATGIDLPEYPVTQFKPKDLERENAKLRELCEGMLVCYEPCNEHLDARTDCPLYDENEPLRCRKARLLRELGIGS